MDNDGTLHHWQAATPESWARLREEAGKLLESELPAEVWRHLEVVPYVCLLLPYRLTSTTSKVLDYATQDRMAQNMVTVTLDVSVPGGTAGIHNNEAGSSDSA